MGCAMGLVALGVGYLVLLSANREKEGVKLLGQAIGIFIMVAAFLSSVCMAMKCGKGECGMSGHGKAPMCPVSGRMMEKAEE